MSESPTKPVVAQISTVHPPFDTRIFQKICRSLNDAGYSVLLIIPYHADEEVDGISIVSLPRIRWRLPRVLLLPLVAIRKALRSKAMIFHFHDPELLPWAMLLRIFGKKVIYDMHENVPASILHKDWMHPRLRFRVSRLWRQIERPMLTRIPTILAEESYAEDYDWHFNKIVVQNFPRFELFEKIEVEKFESTTLAYVGHVHETRGSIIMLDVAARLAAAGFPVDVLYVGYVPPAHERELVSKAQSLGVKLTCTGALPPQKAWPLVAKCHIGFALLAPIPNYTESYPTKMFEYMAMGLPAVVSDFPLYRRMIDATGGGITVDPLDPDGVARAVKPLVADPSFRDRLGRAGRNSVEETFNWRSEEVKLLSLYQQMRAE